MKLQIARPSRRFVIPMVLAGAVSMAACHETAAQEKARGSVPKEAPVGVSQPGSGKSPVEQGKQRRRTVKLDPATKYLILVAKPSATPRSSGTRRSREGGGVQKSAAMAGGPRGPEGGRRERGFAVEGYDAYVIDTPRHGHAALTLTDDSRGYPGMLALPLDPRGRRFVCPGGGVDCMPCDPGDNGACLPGTSGFQQDPPSTVEPLPENGERECRLASITACDGEESISLCNDERYCGSCQTRCRDGQLCRMGTCEP